LWEGVRGRGNTLTLALSHQGRGDLSHPRLDVELFQRFQYSGFDGVRFLHDLVVPEPEDPISLHFQPGGTNRVVVSLLRMVVVATVQLDD
jgi:hypothetical protein